MIMENTCDYKPIYNRVMNSESFIVCKEVGIALEKLQEISKLNTDESFDIKVILCELLQNAIRHGNEMDYKKRISLDMSLQAGDVLEISVEDEGTGFDVQQTMQRKREKALGEDDVFSMDECGRGLLIIENLCDDVFYNFQGNRVTIHKHLHKVVN
jgi:serine/threonine-protein kinase RsbW